MEGVLTHSNPTRKPWCRVTGTGPQQPNRQLGKCANVSEKVTFSSRRSLRYELKTERAKLVLRISPFGIGRVKTLLAKHDWTF
jgi:hypothetical protein